MLKVIKNKTNLIINLPKLEREYKERNNKTTHLQSKFTFNIVSSKEESRFNKRGQQRSFEEYKKIKEEMGFKLLTEEDMAWIDENIYEDNNVQS